jgi:hypothetical protein
VRWAGAIIGQFVKNIGLRQAKRSKPFSGPLKLIFINLSARPWPSPAEWVGNLVSRLRQGWEVDAETGRRTDGSDEK